MTEGIVVSFSDMGKRGRSSLAGKDDRSVLDTLNLRCLWISRIYPVESWMYGLGARGIVRDIY